MVASDALLSIRIRLNFGTACSGKKNPNHLVMGNVPCLPVLSSERAFLIIETLFVLPPTYKLVHYAGLACTALV